MFVKFFVVTYAVKPDRDVRRMSFKSTSLYISVQAHFTQSPYHLNSCNLKIMKGGNVPSLMPHLTRAPTTVKYNVFFLTSPIP